MANDRLTTYEEALARLLADAPAPIAESCEAASAIGRVTAEVVRSTIDLPSFDNSVVDGYAVAELQKGARLRQSGSIQSGQDPAGIVVKPGETVRIFTGAPLPLGTAAVVMQEDVTVDGDTISLHEVPKKGENIRRRGDELRVGDPILPVGTVLNPPALALAAAAGVTHLNVANIPRVGLLTTGNELRSPGEALSAGQIYDANSRGLTAALISLGMPPVNSLHVGDDVADATEEIGKILELVDVLIISGGVSVGDHDPVKPALRALGVETILWGLAIKPGKPFYYGRHAEKAIFGLPGNPLSAMTTFLVLVQPFLRKSLGLVQASDRSEAKLTEEIRRSPGRLEFVPGVWNGKKITPIHRPSHMLSGLAQANAFAVIPCDVDHLEKGERVDILPIRWAL